MPPELGQLPARTFRNRHFFASDELQRGDASSVQLNLGITGMPQCLRLGAGATILTCAITRYFRRPHKRWRHYVEGLPLVLNNAAAFVDYYRPASETVPAQQHQKRFAPAAVSRRADRFRSSVAALSSKLSYTGTRISTASLLFPSSIAISAMSFTIRNSRDRAPMARAFSPPLASMARAWSRSPSAAIVCAFTRSSSGRHQFSFDWRCSVNASSTASSASADLPLSSRASA